MWSLNAVIKMSLTYFQIYTPTLKKERQIYDNIAALNNFLGKFRIYKFRSVKSLKKKKGYNCQEETRVD